MAQEQIELEVINNKSVLFNVIRCVQKRNIPICSFIAEEKSAEEGMIKIILETDKEQLKLLALELEKLKEVHKTDTKNISRPSSELNDIYEE